MASAAATALSPRTLTVGDLLLRPFTEADEPAVAEAMTDRGILRWAAGLAVAHALPRDRARIWLLPRLAGWSTGTAAFAITDADDGRLLGCLGLRDVHRIPDQAIASYWVTPAARGRAVASRALDAAATWGFTPRSGGGLGLHRINLDHSPANQASCRVAVRAGFRPEGTLRESFVDPDGVRHDSHVHGRLATDPAPES